MLAARIGDLHSCPMITGIIPHIGGPVIPSGPSNVFIGGMPAAKVGDLLTCSGPVDAITSGSSSVFVNQMPAARLGDPTAHGGTITQGFNSVIIGG